MILSYNWELTCQHRAKNLSTEIRDATCDRINRLAEECDKLYGFWLVHDTVGGGGSGLSMSILNWLIEQNMCKKAVCSTSIVAGGVEPLNGLGCYNQVMALDCLIEFTDRTDVLNHNALNTIWKTRYSPDPPTHHNINQIIAEAMCTYTSTTRCVISILPFAENWC